MPDHSPSRALDWDIANLPLEVFDLVGGELEVESLTTGHGMVENGASRQTGVCCWLTSCGGCGSDPNPCVNLTE